MPFYSSGADSTAGNWTVGNSTSTTAVNSWGNGYTIDSTSGTTNNASFWIDGRVVVPENEYHADYLREMAFNNVPTVKQWRAQLDPADRKIQDERAWIRSMAGRARERMQERAEAIALDLVADLFGAADTDWLVVPSKLHPGRTYRIPIRDKSLYGSMVRVEENGKLLHKLCAHPSNSLPAGDHAIAKAFWLEANEAEFLEVANVHGL